MMVGVRAARSKFVDSEDVAVHLERVYAYVARRIGPQQVVEDVCSEVLAAALSSRRPAQDVLPWMFGIARRKVADAYRRRGIARETALPAALNCSAEGSHELLVRNEEAVEIRALVDALSDDEREAILLFYVEDLSARQIGRSMGRSEKAINSLLQRARERLRKSGRNFFGEEQWQ